jgi:hypothetical protein
MLSPYCDSTSDERSCTRILPWKSGLTQGRSVSTAGSTKFTPEPWTHTIPRLESLSPGPIPPEGSLSILIIAKCCKLTGARQEAAAYELF